MARERKETARVSCTDLDATLRSYRNDTFALLSIWHSGVNFLGESFETTCDNIKIASQKCSYCSVNWLFSALRPVHTRELAPETRSRNTLPGKYSNQPVHAPAKQISVHTRELAPETRSRKANFSTDGGACSWNTLPQSKSQYTRGSLLLNRIVQQFCPWSLLSHIKPVWWSKTREQNFCCATYFSLEIVGADEGALLRERVAGACCRSKLPRVYRPLSL